jgi:hypothetical protein
VVCTGFVTGSGPVKVSFEHGNGPSGSIKFGEIFGSSVTGDFSRRAQLLENNTLWLHKRRFSVGIQ